MSGIIEKSFDSRGRRIAKTVNRPTSVHTSATQTWRYASVIHKRNETSFQYDNYEEVQATTVAGFISELGGQSNLFIGASLLIVIHVATCTISLVRRGVEALIRH